MTAVIFEAKSKTLDRLTDLGIKFEIIKDTFQSKFNDEHENADIMEHIKKVQESLKSDTFKRADIYHRKQAFARLKGFEMFSDMVKHYRSAHKCNMMYSDHLTSFGTEKLVDELKKMEVENG